MYSTKNNKNKYGCIETQRMSLSIPDVPEKYDPIDAKKGADQGLFAVIFWVYLMVLFRQITIQRLLDHL